MSASSEDNCDYGLMSILDLDFDHDLEGNLLPDADAASGGDDKRGGYCPPDHAPFG